MIKRWFCLLLALAVGWASVCCAEEIVIEGEAVIAEAAEGELIIGELDEYIELPPIGDLALELPDDGGAPGLLDEGLIAEGEWALDGDRETAEAPNDEEQGEPRLTLSAEKLLIGIGEKCTALKATRSPEDAGDTITWASGKTSVAKVDKKTGKITGVKKGKATITASTASGLTASCVVTVKKAPHAVTLSPAKLTLSEGDTSTLTGKMSSDKGSTLTFTSADKGVATVERYTGVVTAVSAGSTTITVKTFNGHTAKCALTVVAAPSQVFLPETLTIALNEKVSVSARAVDAEGVEVPATFTYRAKKGTGKISVNKKTGKIAGKALGTAWLYVTAHNGVCTHLVDGMPVETVCAVNVVEAPDRVELAADAITIGVDQTFELSPRMLAADGSAIEGAVYTVETSSESVASVSDTGTVKGLKKGSATVTVKAAGGVSASCKVTVLNAPDRVTLSPEQLTLSAGSGARLTVTLPENTMASYAFSSSDEAVASVDGEGNVTAIAPGTAVVRVETGNQLVDECAVSVVETASGLVVSPAAVVGQLSEGGMQLTWRFPEGQTPVPVRFQTADASVATVSEEGYITYAGAGSTKLTVVADDGQQANVDVTVLDDADNPVKYRLFAAYSYSDSLPFVKRNCESMAKVFKKSSIDGERYATKVLSNPSKSGILSGISGFLGDADDNDVSIVYFCSHGHNNKDSYSSYRLSLKGYDSNKNNSKYYLTSKEIFNSVQAIGGNVILILDSCYSGTFINDMKSKLNGEDGRIAVLAAASNTRATYYNSTSKSVDFFTFFLLQGLGYNEKEGWWTANAGGDKGSYPGYFAADRKGNGDGAATLNEFYSFASNSIDANIPTYMKKSWYWGDTSKVQKTRLYAGNLKKLVIYRPE